MNLIVQGPGLIREQAQELAGLLRIKSIEVISARAFRFKNPPLEKQVVETWAAERQVDHAWVPEGRRFADLRLLAMDMDSTLITIECIDELGDMAGKKAEIAGITAQAMAGEIDYPESLRRRVALLAGLKESALERVYQERLHLTPGAEALVFACKRSGVKLLLVSGGFTFFTERLKARLDLDYTVSNTLEVEHGRITGKVLGNIIGAEAKAAKFVSILKSLRTTKEHSVAIGDGANDLKMMAEAGLSIAFHAKPVVRAQASCAINWSGLDAVVNLFE